MEDSHSKRRGTNTASAQSIEFVVIKQEPAGDDDSVGLAKKMKVEHIQEEADSSNGTKKFPPAQRTDHNGKMINSSKTMDNTESIEAQSGTEAGNPQQRTRLYDHEQCLCLIAEVEVRPVLWRKNHIYYKNKEKSMDSWIDIGNVMQINPAEAKNTWFRLRNSYRSLRARVRSHSSGSATTGFNKHCKWFAFESMRFLDDTDEFGETTDSVQLSDPFQDVDIQPTTSTSSSGLRPTERTLMCPTKFRGSSDNLVTKSRGPSYKVSADQLKRRFRIPLTSPAVRPLNLKQKQQQQQSTSNRQSAPRIVGHSSGSSIDPLFANALNSCTELCKKITDRLDSNIEPDGFLYYLRDKLNRKKPSDKNKIERQLLEVLDSFSDDDTNNSIIEEEYLENV